MKNRFGIVLILLLFMCLVSVSQAVQTFTDLPSFESALSNMVTTITFEGIASGGGQANAVNLVGNEFPDITLIPGPGADGLFVGIPDSTIPGGNLVDFFAADFFPTSGDAVFSPDAYSDPPEGTLIVDFDVPRTGVGVFFLDVESAISSIEAFDGPGGTGNSIAKVTLQNMGDDSQAFAGIVADDIRSAVLIIGGSNDGVGMDDLCYGPVPEPATLLLLGLGGLTVLRKRRA